MLSARIFKIMAPALFGPALILTACSPEKTMVTDAPVAELSAGKISILIFRDAECGCCADWAVEAREAGYLVRVKERDSMAQMKRSLGVPFHLASCQTALIGGYVLEGQVPFAYVDKLLAEQPKDIIGLSFSMAGQDVSGIQLSDENVTEAQVIGFSRRGPSRIFTL